jgi:hypothetical protein
VSHLFGQYHFGSGRVHLACHVRLCVWSGNEASGSDSPQLTLVKSLDLSYTLEFSSNLIHPVRTFPAEWKAVSKRPTSRDAGRRRLQFIRQLAAEEEDAAAALASSKSW